MKALQNFSIDESRINFWKNTSQITKFSNGVLKFFDIKNKKVNIDITYSTIPSVNTVSEIFDSNIINFYYISLPNLSSLAMSEKQKFKEIFSRSIYLKHELAHVVFSDFNWLNENKEISRLINILEDARVEYLYSNVLKGNKRTFLQMNYFHYLRDKVKIETEEYNIINLLLFIKYSLDGIRIWNKTEQIKEYDVIYKKYINKLLSLDNYKQAMLDIINEQEKNISEEINITHSPQEYYAYGDINDGTSFNIDEDYKEYQKARFNNMSEIITINDEESIKEELFGEEYEDVDLISEIMKDDINEVRDAKGLLNNISKKEKEILDIDGFTISPYDVEDVITLNINKFFQYFKGMSLVTKQGTLAYRNIIIENKKVIDESVRFLKLKLQNKSRDKIRKFQLEGELDQENIQNIIIQKENPKAFLKRIKTINPKSSIHILIDISTSMNVNQLNMCIINAIILYEVAKKVGLKYSFQMFTSLPGKTFSVKERKDAIKLRTVLPLFKGHEQNIYISFVGNENTFYSLQKIINIPEYFFGKNVHKVRFGGNKGIIYYIKGIEDELNPLYEKMLGNLFLKTAKIRSYLGGATPEFECFSQVIKLHKRDNSKNKILFLINDGHYDSSFANNKNSIETIINSFDKFSYFENDKSLTNLNIYKTLKELHKFKQYIFEHKADFDIDNFDLFYSINKYLIELQSIFTYILEIKEINISTIAQEIKDKFSDYEVYINSYNNNISISKNDYKFNQKINEIFNSLTMPSHIIYKKLIDGLRLNGWKIFGGGIRSSSGISYIGYKNFAVFHDVQDIKDNFCKKLRNYF